MFVMFFWNVRFLLKFFFKTLMSNFWSHLLKKKKKGFFWLKRNCLLESRVVAALAGSMTHTAGASSYLQRSRNGGKVLICAL